MADDAPNNEDTSAGESSSVSDPSQNSIPALDPDPATSIDPNDPSEADPPVCEDPSNGGNSVQDSCLVCDTGSEGCAAKGEQQPNTCNSMDRSGCLPSDDLIGWKIPDFGKPFRYLGTPEFFARYETWHFQAAILAANAAGFTVGVGLGVDANMVFGVSGAGGYVFTPDFKVSVWGSVSPENFGVIIGADLNVSFIVLFPGHSQDFAGSTFAIGASADLMLGPGAQLLFSKGDDGNLHCIGFSTSGSIGNCVGIYVTVSHTWVSPSLADTNP